MSAVFFLFSLSCCQSCTFQIVWHHNSTNFDKIPNTTDWNAAPDHDLHCCTCFLEAKSSNLRSSLHKSCCHWFPVQLLSNLAYISLFSLFSFLKNDCSTATPWTQFLVRLSWIVHESICPCWRDRWISQVLCVTSFLKMWLSVTVHLLQIKAKTH